MVWHIELNKSDVENQIVEDSLYSENSSPILPTLITRITESPEITETHSYSNSSILNDLHQSTNLSPPMIDSNRGKIPNHNIMKELFETILTRVDQIEVINTSLNEEINEFKNRVSLLENSLKESERIKKLNDQKIKDLERRLIRNEQYVNRESLIISGIPDRINQNNLEKEVLRILKTIGLDDISHYDITACHRLQKNNNERYPARTIVRFMNRKIPTYCLKNRRSLTQLKYKLKMNLRFYECLCPTNEKILKNSAELKKYGLINDYYIRNGFIKIVISENDSPIKICHLDQLKELFKDFFLAEELYPQ